MMATHRHFTSDNGSGVHPKVFAWLEKANRGHAAAYGDDPLTGQAVQLFRTHFGESVRPYFVLTGTAANVIALKSVMDSFEAVICADSAHLQRDECGAPEKFLGGKLLLVSGREGKLTIDSIRPLLRESRMVHRVQPKVVSISQCTEWGTVYSLQEVRELAEFCHANGLLLHLDGARLCNAAAALNRSLKEITADLGVDLLSFGGTKNGLMMAEAVVMLNPQLGDKTPFYRKQGMQLASKMRFVAAQFIAYLEGDLWRQNALHANRMARELAERAARIQGIEITLPVQTNAVFARLPDPWIPRLQERCPFHLWDSNNGVVRWMTSFDSTEEDIEDFIQHIREVAGG